MYYYLDKCLQPLTTVERDGLLSHFAVHLSPIFYALLPFYKLVPRPETLLVLQALLVISGLIPLCLLARALKCTRPQILCFGPVSYTHLKRIHRAGLPMGNTPLPRGVIAVLHMQPEGG